MGTLIATLLSAEPITTWVHATFAWLTSRGSICWVTAKRSTQPNPAPGWFLSFFHAERGEFPASRGVLILTCPPRVGSTR
jgi:hypothetical protein